MTDLPALRGFVDELVEGGVTDAVVCPGSRSTPLALALRAHSGVRVRVLLDERGAGFFALGLGMATRRPAAVVTTSGTAAANLLPAVVEASLGRVPLLVITADRPPELRDRGAVQAIDQDHLFGRHARWFAEVGFRDDDASRRHVRGVAARAVATARGGPAGPVHLNVPVREPLVPVGDLGPLAPAGTASDVLAGWRMLEAADVDRLAARLAGVERGLIVAGPQVDPDLPAALGRLAEALDWPILADPLSLVRCGPHDRSRVVSRGDHLLRPGPWLDAHLPDLVLRFGAMPTSKPLLALLDDRRPELVVVDGDGGWREPAALPVTMVHADATRTAGALVSALASRPDRSRPRGGHPDWLAGWLAADRAADRVLAEWLAKTTAVGEPFEGAPFAHLGELLPDGAVLWASSSMPVRDLDAWLGTGRRAIRPLASRGANGIDGVVSAALGAAAAGERVTLVVGDLALLHDLGGLVTARRHGLAATVVVVNNDGGGIFSFLPQASAQAPGAGLPDHFEELFGTPHGIELGPLVTALGATHRVVGAGDLREALATAATAPPNGVNVLELRTERARNVALHREAGAAVAAALAALPADPPAAGEPTGAGEATGAGR